MKMFSRKIDLPKSEPKEEAHEDSEIESIPGTPGRSSFIFRVRPIRASLTIFGEKMWAQSRANKCALPRRGELNAGLAKTRCESVLFKK